MRFKPSSLFLLGLVAITFVVYYQSSRLEERKKFTQPAFEITNGTLGDQTMRKSSAESVAKLSIFEAAQPVLIAFRIMPDRGRYIVAAYWVGHSKFADGLEITFSSGAKVVTPFSKDKSS